MDLSQDCGYHHHSNTFSKESIIQWILLLVGLIAFAILIYVKENHVENDHVKSIDAIRHEIEQFDDTKHSIRFYQVTTITVSLVFGTPVGIILCAPY